MTGSSSERPLDLVHLARQTLGDPQLEAEVLRLFSAQSDRILSRLPSADATERRRLAHTLKGSARAIGAWEVVRAAETIECDDAAAIDTLAGALARAQAMIGEIAA